MRRRSKGRALLNWKGRLCKTSRSLRKKDTGHGFTRDITLTLRAQLFVRSQGSFECFEK